MFLSWSIIINSIDSLSLGCKRFYHRNQYQFSKFRVFGSNQKCRHDETKIIHGANTDLTP